MLIFFIFFSTICFIVIIFLFTACTFVTWFIKDQSVNNSHSLIAAHAFSFYCAFDVNIHIIKTSGRGLLYLQHL